MINCIKRFHKITKYTNYMVIVISCVLILTFSTEIAIFFVYSILLLYN